MNDISSNTRLIAKLAREVAARQQFASYPDLKDALRRRLSQLHIRYQPPEFDDAGSLVTSNASLWRTPRPAHMPPKATAPALSRAESKRLYDDLRRQFRARF